MYQDYKDLADIYIVYIREAHAADSNWPVPYAREKGIKKHKSFADRCVVADMLVKEKKLTIPCLIDGMDNLAATSYAAWPDRIFVVQRDGRVAVAAKRGPWGFPPGVNQTRDWLAAFKKTGEEPPLPEVPADDADSAPGEPTAPVPSDASEPCATQPAAAEPAGTNQER